MRTNVRFWHISDEPLDAANVGNWAVCGRDRPWVLTLTYARFRARFAPSLTRAR